MPMIIPRHQHCHNSAVLVSFVGVRYGGADVVCWGKWRWCWYPSLGQVAVVLMSFVGVSCGGAGIGRWGKLRW